MLAAGVSDWVASLLPTDDAPAWLNAADDTVNVVFGNLNGVGVWVDWVYILIVVGVVLSVWSIGLLIKLARAVAAHIPLFGGAG